MSRKDLNGEMRLFCVFFFDTPMPCGILVSQPRMETVLSALEVQSLSHRTTRKVSCEMRFEQRPHLKKMG